MFEARRPILRCVQLIHVESKLINWFCPKKRIDSGSSFQNPKAHPRNVYYHTSMFFSSLPSWPWSEFVHIMIMPAILLWPCCLTYWLRWNGKSKYSTTSWCHVLKRNTNLISATEFEIMSALWGMTWAPEITLRYFLLNSDNLKSARGCHGMQNCLRLSIALGPRLTLRF